MIRWARGLIQPYLTEAGKTAAWNLFGLGAATCVSQGCLLFIVLLLARHLSAEDFGAFMFAVTLQGYLLLVSTGGTATVVVREGAQRPDRMDAILSSYLAITLAGGLLTAAVVIGAAILLPLSAVERQLVILIAVGNIGAGVYWPSLFDLFHRQARGAGVGAGVDVAAALVVVALHTSGNLTMTTAGAVLAGKWFLTTIVQGVVFCRTIHPLKWSPSASEIKGLLSSGYPLLLGWLLWLLPVNGGVFLLRAFRGLEETAVYAIAVQVATAYILFTNLGVRVVQPHINGIHGLERSFIRKLALFTAVSLSGLWLAAAAAGAVVILAVLEPVYREAFVPMLLLLAAASVLSINLLLSIYLTRLHREKAVMAGKALAAAFWVVAGFCLVPFTGVVATAFLAILASLLALTVLVLNLSACLNGG